MLRAQMTLLPSLLQPIHYNAITQSKRQKYSSTSKKMLSLKPWHENQDITICVYLCDHLCDPWKYSY